MDTCWIWNAAKMKFSPLIWTQLRRTKYQQVSEKGRRLVHYPNLTFLKSSSWHESCKLYYIIRCSPWSKSDWKQDKVKYWLLQNPWDQLDKSYDFKKSSLFGIPGFTLLSFNHSFILLINRNSFWRYLKKTTLQNENSCLSLLSFSSWVLYYEITGENSIQIGV